MNEQKRNQIERAAKAGFTLMEVMIAVMIIGLLTAVAVPAIGTYMKRARITATQDQLNSIRTALGTYQGLHNNKLPESLDELTSGDEPLIEQEGELNDAWGEPFRYEHTKRFYTITSAAEDGEFDTEDDLYISNDPKRNKKSN